jgi:predicted phage-related endonuclease
MKIGRLMEPVTRQVYTEITRRGVVPAEPYQLHTSEKYPWLGASLDAVDTEGDLLELKNHGDWMKDESDIPGGWYLQCQTQLLITGRARIRLVVLIKGCDMKIFDLEPNAEIQAEILARSKAFWDDMKAGRVPAPTVPEDNDNYKYIWAPVTGSTIELDGFEFNAAGQMREALKKQIKALEEDLDMVEAKVKHALGENEVGVLEDGGYWSWKPDSRGYRKLLYRGPK